MTPMLRLTLERFELATEKEKPEIYNREFDKREVLSAVADVHNMQTLLTMLRDFLQGNQSVGVYREINVQP